MEVSAPAIIEQGRLIRQATIEELTTSALVVAVSADLELEKLHEAIADFPGATSVRTVEDRVFVELGDGGPADLNKFLVERGIYAGHLAEQKVTLEEAFMKLTGGEHGFGEVH